MTMTRDQIAELKRKAQATDTYLNPRLEREFAAACDPKTILSLLALAERALEPQGQALDEMYDAIEDTPEAAATFWREEPEPGTPLAVERFTWHLKVQVPPGRANFENLFTARQMIAHGRKCWEAGRASQLALPAGPVPEGFVLVPMHLNAEMRDVLSEEDWTWEDLLVAANAVTEEQYYAIQSGDGESPAVAQPVADERDAFEKWAKLDEMNIGRRVEWFPAIEFAWNAWKARAALCQPAEEGDKA